MQEFREAENFTEDFEKLENFFPQKNLYFVESPEDQTVLVAIDAFYVPRSQTIHWFDTVKERIKKVNEIIEIGPEKLVFRDETGTTYAFQKLTLEIFNERVKAKMVNVGDWKTEEEMEKGLRSAYKNVLTF
jgi:hypothetical protein